jgi:endoglucanase
LLCLYAPLCAQTTDIKVDQVGYLADAPKLAIVAAATPAQTFVVRRGGDNATLFRGPLSAPVEDADSGDRVQIADFSKLTAPGVYFLEVPGVGQSWNFTISPQVYARAFYLAMRSYYGQRCGTAVDLGGEFHAYKHDACHVKGAYHESSGKSGPHPSVRGWHDAGDYGRYIVNSGISTGTLLWAWEMFGERIKKLGLKIPESGKGTPDMLSEIRWNLEWMLSMQDSDGGVWHKQTSERFCPFVMPEKDLTVSYVIGTGHMPFKSSCATADFAAVMAIAGRVYRPFDREFAERCMKAARSAWTWLAAHPDTVFHNPPGVGTGEYGDADCGDEQLWASAEIWRSTGDPVFERYFLEHYSKYREALRATKPQWWADVAPMALWTYVLGHGVNKDAVTAIRGDALRAANEIVERTARNGYRVSLMAADYIWGSNGVAANYGMQLLVANAMEPNARFVETALDNLHYLLGRNTFSLSWVTQLGDHPFKHPHHRPSGASGLAEPWPGLLAGGPNRNRNDAAMRKLPATLPPAKMYIDEQTAYSCNEVAINWHAPLVFVLAGAGLR